MAKIVFHIEGQKPIKECTREAQKKGFRVNKLPIHIGMAEAMKAKVRAGLMAKLFGSLSLLLASSFGTYVYFDEHTQVKALELLAVLTNYFKGG